MDHIKLIVYGLIGTGIVFAVVALITKMLGIQKY
jgi:hypothetical protein